VEREWKGRMRERNGNEIRRVEEIVNRSQGESQVRGKDQEIVQNRIGHRRSALVKVQIVVWSVWSVKKNRCCDDANESSIRRTRWVIGTGYL
jgi:hypothetical protein